MIGKPSKCEHEWGNKIITDGRRYNSERDGKGVGQNQGAQGRHSVKGQFCRHCNAWHGSLGLEPTPELYIQHIVQVFRELWRVLRKDGVCWLNLGDSYWGGKGQSAYAWSTEHQDRKTLQKAQHQITGRGETRPQDGKHDILKPKDLCMIPARVALALQAEGWWLRSDIIWAKPNPMPESVTDRPTTAHEHVFLLTKSQKYFYDADAVREKANYPNQGKWSQGDNKGYQDNQDFKARKLHDFVTDTGRNLRSVWTIATQPFPKAHFATFPEKLVETCILAGTNEGDTVLDPFSGRGTVLVVAKRMFRKAIGIDLKAEYHEMSAGELKEGVLEF